MTKKKLIKKITKIQDMGKQFTYEEKKQFCEEKNIKFSDFYLYRYSIITNRLDILIRELKEQK